MDFNVQATNNWFERTHNVEDWLSRKAFPLSSNGICSSR
jgi:hypothetical protein